MDIVICFDKRNFGKRERRNYTENYKHGVAETNGRNLLNVCRLQKKVITELVNYLRCDAYTRIVANYIHYYLKNIEQGAP